MKVIEEIMQTFPQSCGTHDTLDTAMTKMASAEKQFLPVVDQDEKLLGMVTYQDCVNGTQEVPKEDARVVKVMNPITFYVHTYDDEATAFTTMRHNHIGHLPVVDNDNQFRGMISFMSLARRIVKLKNDLKRVDYKFKKKKLKYSL